MGGIEGEQIRTQRREWGCIQYVPGLGSQERKKIRKNFRGITFFASFETPISVIKKILFNTVEDLDTIKIKENAEKIFYFFCTYTRNSILYRSSSLS
jgi:hypothetical protein